MEGKFKDFEFSEAI